MRRTLYDYVRRFVCAIAIIFKDLRLKMDEFVGVEVEVEEFVYPQARRRTGFGFALFGLTQCRGRCRRSGGRSRSSARGANKLAPSATPIM